MNTSGPSTDGEEAADRVHLLRSLALCMRRHIEAEEAFQHWLKNWDTPPGSYQLSTELNELFVRELIANLRDTRSSQTVVIPAGPGFEFGYSSRSRSDTLVTSPTIERLLGAVPRNYFGREVPSPRQAWAHYYGLGDEAGD